MELEWNANWTRMELESNSNGTGMIQEIKFAEPPFIDSNKKMQKIGKCHETDKYPTKSDENWSIWSQTGQGNLFRGVPDQKKKI